MKLLFQTDVLCYRGSTVAITDYARYMREFLGHKSVICYDWARPYHADGGTEPEVLEALQKEFQVIGYDNLNELQGIIDDEKIDFALVGSQVSLTNCRYGHLEAFQIYNPYGDAYAYISKWLADTMNARHGSNWPYVPHIISLPAPNTDFKQQLGIRPDQTVIGRYGGLFTFNLPFVQQAVRKIVESRDDFVFLFANTQPFINHPNVKFVKEFYSLQAKANFIATCDAMLHARSNGESFGIAVGEFLSLNKPVLVWEGGEDQNHVAMMKDSGLIYNQNNVQEKILNIRDYINQEDWSQRVAEFQPRLVIEKFKEVFF
jgi:hypothetical protein